MAKRVSLKGDRPAHSKAKLTKSQTVPIDGKKLCDYLDKMLAEQREEREFQQLRIRLENISRLTTLRCITALSKRLKSYQ